MLTKPFRGNITIPEKRYNQKKSYPTAGGKKHRKVIVTKKEKSNTRPRKTNKIYQSGIVHTDTAEQILDIFRAHLSTHPPRYFGDIDSIAEFLYFQYTETNPVENETVRKSYTAFMDELTEALGYDKGTWSEEVASIEAKVNVAVSEYEKAAYIEGMKLEARIVMELCGVISKE